jgi:hypothetical protein
MGSTTLFKACQNVDLLGIYWTRPIQERSNHMKENGINANLFLWIFLK